MTQASLFVYFSNLTWSRYASAREVLPYIILQYIRKACAGYADDREIRAEKAGKAAEKGFRAGA